jgi:DNA-binding response OmpR family regulator
VTDRVLVVEDDPDIALGVETVLGRSGFEVTTAGEGREGLRLFHTERPDLVILDVGLPEMDGWTVLTRIRELSEVPVLMLTARGHESDKVRGLRSGADDYLTKPFGNAEFIARVQALLRRSLGAETQGAEVYDDGMIRVDFAAHEVQVDGAQVELTATEFRLLAALIRHRGQVLSPNKLLDLVWSDPFGVGPERVKYSVLRLRRKLGRALTHRGGPRLRLPVPVRRLAGLTRRTGGSGNRAAPWRQPHSDRDAGTMSAYGIQSAARAAERGAVRPAPAGPAG